MGHRLRADGAGHPDAGAASDRKHADALAATAGRNRDAGAGESAATASSAQSDAPTANGDDSNAERLSVSGRQNVSRVGNAESRCASGHGGPQ